MSRVLPTWLSDVISPIAVERFLSDVFGEAPRVFSDGRYREAFGIEEAEELLWCHEHSIATRVLAVTAAGKLHPPRRREHKDLFRWTVDQYREGAALWVDDLPHMLPWVARLAGDCARELLSYVTAGALVMPPSAESGLPERWGRADLLALQTAGKSLWDLQAQESGSVAFEQRRCGLVATDSGAALYVPGGGYVAARATDGPSVIVLLRIQPLTQLDLLE